jgi:PEP-CTERM motif-containing protein
MMKLHIAAAVVVAGLSTGSAWAAPYVLSGGAAAGDLTGWVTYTPDPSNPPTINVNAYIGPLNMNVKDVATNIVTPQTVWCTDIFDDFQSGGQYTLSSSSLGTRLGPTKLGQINALLANALLSQEYSDDMAAGGAAIQAAIWEIENETANFGYNVTTPALQVHDLSSDAGTFATDVALFLHNVSGTIGTDGLWQPDGTQTVMEYVPTDPLNNQSFGFLQLDGGGRSIPTPEPASLVLLGGGLAGLAVVRRKKTRPAA